MTEEQFWDFIKKNIEVPFDFKDIDLIEPDLTGSIVIDLKNGTSYAIDLKQITDWEDIVY